MWTPSNKYLLSRLGAKKTIPSSISHIHWRFKARLHEEGGDDVWRGAEGLSAPLPGTRSRWPPRGWKAPCRPSGREPPFHHYASVAWIFHKWSVALEWEKSLCGPVCDGDSVDLHPEGRRLRRDARPILDWERHPLAWRQGIPRDSHRARIRIRHRIREER